jgi:hypothetical protein
LGNIKPFFKINMRKELYLTFDIEIVTAKFSRNSGFLSSICIAPLIIAKELKDRGLKGVFFICLSPKIHDASFKEYEYYLDILINSLKSFDNIQIAPHIHARNLPMEFSTFEDRFDRYDGKQQQKLLNWAKEFFLNYNIEVNLFRSGGFYYNEDYYENMKPAGYLMSSLLFRNESANINLINKQTLSNKPRIVDGIIEFPVSSVKVKSIKGKEEVVNLSPEFFTLESVKNYFEKLDYININFHSFSLLVPKLIRENHKFLILRNLKFLILERPLNIILNKIGITPIYNNAVLKRELFNYLDYFEKNKDKFESKFFTNITN